MSRPRVAVLDYDAGNVRSAQRGLEHAGAEATITADPGLASKADALVVPGVGHFGSCLASLRSLGLEPVVRDAIDAGSPVLGICVGLQLLYASSEEGAEPGLGVLPGKVVRFQGEDVVVPHMGWDVVAAAPGHDDDPLLRGVAGERCYFVHSYYAVPDDPAHVVGVCAYGGADFPCLVRVGNVVGTQFHPEKSGDIGARLLTNWIASL